MEVSTVDELTFAYSCTAAATLSSLLSTSFWTVSVTTTTPSNWGSFMSKHGISLGNLKIIKRSRLRVKINLCSLQEIAKYHLLQWRPPMTSFDQFGHPQIRAASTFTLPFCTSLKTCCTSSKLLQKVRKYTKFTHYCLTFSCRQFGPGPGKDNLVTLISDITWFMNSPLHEVPSY